MYNEAEYVAGFAQKAREILTKAGVESARVTTTFNLAGDVHTGVGLVINIGDANSHDLMREIQAIKDGAPEVEATVNIAVDVCPEGWSADVFEPDNTSALGLFDFITRPTEFHFEPQPLPEPSDEELARLEQLWENNAPRFEPNPGATDEELDTLEKALGMPITGQLRALLKLVNGVELSWDEYDEDSEEFDESDITRGMDLLSAESIAKEHKNWLDLAAYNYYDDVAYDMGEPCRTQPRLVHPGWIPASKEEPKLTQPKPILALGSPAKLAEEYAGLALGGFYGLGIAASVTAVMNVLRTRRK